MAKSSKKSGKKLSLKKKPLKDLPVRGKGASAKGGADLTFGKLGDVNMAPPYVPIGPTGILIRPPFKPGL